MESIMGFLGNLGKGFIRSAVNQVGRDTGKVFSNSIYGDAHATPIRSVGIFNGVYIDDETQIPLTEKELTDRLKNEGYKIEYFNFNIFLKILNWVIGLFFTIMLFFMGGYYWALIPPCALVLVALLKFIASFQTMSVYQQKEVSVYKSDRRYKEGRKFMGFSKEKVKYNIPPTKDYKIKTSIICFVYLCLAALMYWKAYDIYINEMNEEKTEIVIEEN